MPNPTTKYADSLAGDYSITAKLSYGGGYHLACYRFNTVLILSIVLNYEYVVVGLLFDRLRTIVRKQNGMLDVRAAKVHSEVLDNAVEMQRQWRQEFETETPTCLKIECIIDKFEMYGMICDIHKGR
ncbi:hypothetical protein C0J52_15949 [Blattella germanica]|nr:hypothetical protein C0J52_15949 [Blattella germanica]